MINLFFHLFKKNQPKKDHQPYVMQTEIGEFTMLYRRAGNRKKARVPTGEFFGKVRWNGHAEPVNASFHCDNSSNPFVAKNGLQKLKEVLIEASILEQKAKQYILEMISDEANDAYTLWETYRKPAYTASREEFIQRLRVERVEIFVPDGAPEGANEEIYLFFQINGDAQYNVLIDEHGECIHLDEP